MSLEIRKTISLTGESKVDGKAIVYFSANVSTDENSNTSFNQNIVEQELYQANRLACRKDATAFQNAVYDVEDQLAAEQEQAK